MYEKTILCLANSRKPPSGKCVAGRVFDGKNCGEWLRPVSAREKREVSEEERRYPEGKLAQLFHIISVPLVEPKPIDHQIENHILDKDYYWQKVGVATWQQVYAAIDKNDAAFWANCDSTIYGLNDKVHSASAKRLGSSLKLIEVTDLDLIVAIEPGYQGAPGRKRVRGRFTYGRTTYTLSLTDPEIEDEQLVKAPGTYHIGCALLCVSIVEVWNDYAFRVIASVLTEARCGAAK